MCAHASWVCVIDRYMCASSWVCVDLGFRVRGFVCASWVVGLLWWQSDWMQDWCNASWRDPFGYRSVELQLHGFYECCAFCCGATAKWGAPWSPIHHVEIKWFSTKKTQEDYVTMCSSSNDIIYSNNKIHLYSKQDLWFKLDFFLYACIQMHPSPLKQILSSIIRSALLFFSSQNYAQNTPNC